MKEKGNQPFVVKREVFEYVTLVDQNDKFIPQIKTTEAIQLASSLGLDLVCFKRGEGQKLSFCKMVDFGKWKYANEKKNKQNKKTGVTKKTTKELRFSPDIGDNDIQHKIKQAIEFLNKGAEVLLEMRLKGRQRLYFKDAETKLNEIAGLCADVGEEIHRRKSGNCIVIRLKKK